MGAFQLPGRAALPTLNKPDTEKPELTPTHIRRKILLIGIDDLLLLH